MAPQSSPSSSAPSPSLKRNQPTISSFFTQKPTSTPRSSATHKDTDITAVNISKKRPASPEPEAEADEDDDDVVAPPAKRARKTGPTPDKQSRKTSPPPEKQIKNTSPILEKQLQPPTEPVAHPPSQLSSSQRTDIFKFQSPQAAPPTQDENAEDAQRRKEKEKMHQKFVRRLGGADCLIGIGRNATAPDAAVEVEEGEEADADDEPAPPPKKGKATAKKGGSKLTPMERQVIDIKRKNMDTVLVIEVGYKFRFFGEDARTAAKELGIVCIPGKFRFDERR